MEQETKDKMLDFLFAGRYYFAAAVGATIIGLSVLDILSPPPEPVGTSTWLGLGVGWLVFAVGLAWIVHGFGFIVVRVSR